MILLVDGSVEDKRYTGAIGGGGGGGNVSKDDKLPVMGCMLFTPGTFIWLAASAEYDQDAARFVEYGFEGDIYGSCSLPLTGSDISEEYGLDIALEK